MGRSVSRRSKARDTLMKIGIITLGFLLSVAGISSSLGQMAPEQSPGDQWSPGAPSPKNQSGKQENAQQSRTPDARSIQSPPPPVQYLPDVGRQAKLNGAV